MKFDFDKVPERRGTDCLKYDFAVERGMPKNVLPLWVADMDFPTAPCVTDRIHEIADHGILGYTEAKADYYDIVCSWFRKRFDWDARPEWIVKTPGVVFALAMCVKAFTCKGDGVLIQQPVYYPFSEVITDNDRRLVNCPLVYRDRTYTVDLKAFEETILRERVKLFLLCSPHNPVGRVWTQEELRGMEEICLKHGVVVVSDEIHCDFVWGEHTHYPLLSLDERYAENVVLCTAPSKTFNIAGAQVSNIFIADETLRQAFKKQVNAAGYSQLNTLAIECCKAAYTGGEEWLEAVKDYIAGNIAFASEYISSHMPGVHLVQPEGTYLLWLDLRDLHISAEEQQNIVVNKAGLWLDSGAVFGPDGEGFERINAACTRAVLREALERLAEALQA